MYFNKLKKLRLEKELTQKQLSEKLKCSRSAYNNWERGVVMIPIDIADELSIFYNVKLSYILGVDETLTKKRKIGKMDYKILLRNLNELKTKNNHTYKEIATYLQCDISTCQRYFKGTFKIPIDRLISLSEFYNMDIDKMCGK